MKINGRESIGRKQETFILRRKKEVKCPTTGEMGYEPDNLELILTAAPLGYWEKMAEEIPVPKPPQKGYMRDKVSDKVIRDPVTKAPIPLIDDKDPDFVKAENRASRLQTIAMVVESLKENNIEWKNKREDFKTPAEFYEAIEEEFKDFGLSMGELAELISAVTRVSMLSGQEIEEAKNLFLSDE